MGALIVASSTSMSKSFAALRIGSVNRVVTGSGWPALLPATRGGCTLVRMTAQRRSQEFVGRRNSWKAPRDFDLRNANLPIVACILHPPLEGEKGNSEWARVR